MIFGSSTFYLRITGDDANDGITPAKAFRAMTGDHGGTVVTPAANSLVAWSLKVYEIGAYEYTRDAGSFRVIDWEEKTE